jgi:hypothetical protein
VKRELGFEGIKGGRKEKKGLFFLLRLGLLLQREERLTDFLVGVGNPQHI